MVLILKISLAHAYMVMVLVRSQNFSDFRLLLQFQDYYFSVPNKKKLDSILASWKLFLLHSKCTFEAVQDPGDLGSAAAALQVHGDNQDCHLQIKQTFVGKQS